MASGVVKSCQGTPLHNMLLRLMGAKIGSSVVVDTASISEPELVTVQVSGLNLCQLVLLNS
jgi:hypothetical protein